MLHELDQFLDDLLFLTLIGSVLVVFGLVIQKNLFRLKHIPFIEGFIWYLKLFSFILVGAGLFLSLFILGYRATTSEDVAAETVMMSTNLVLMICSVLAASLFAAMSLYLLKEQKKDRGKLDKQMAMNKRLRNTKRQEIENLEPAALALEDLRDHLWDTDQDLVDPRDILDLIDELLKKHSHDVQSKTRKTKAE